MIKVEISDSSAFGIPHHNHEKHTVTIYNLSYEDAKFYKKLLEKFIKE